MTETVLSRRGPWRRNGQHVFNSHGNKVAVVANDHGYHQFQSDGQLIEAAPEIQDALFQIFVAFGMGNTPEKFCREILPPLMEDAKAALIRSGLEHHWLK